jgi:hypothetical protein
MARKLVLANRVCLEQKMKSLSTRNAGCVLVTAEYVMFVNVERALGLNAR